MLNTPEFVVINRKKVTARTSNKVRLRLMSKYQKANAMFQISSSNYHREFIIFVYIRSRLGT